MLAALLFEHSYMLHYEVPRSLDFERKEVILVAKFLNFVMLVSIEKLADYAAEVVSAAAESNLILSPVVYLDDDGNEINKKGNKEVWRLTGRSGSGKNRRKHSVTAYEGGSVTFQNIEHGSLNVSGKVVNKW